MPTGGPDGEAGAEAWPRKRLTCTGCARLPRFCGRGVAVKTRFASRPEDRGDARIEEDGAGRGAAGRSLASGLLPG